MDNPEFFAGNVCLYQPWGARYEILRNGRSPHLIYSFRYMALLCPFRQQETQTVRQLL